MNRIIGMATGKTMNPAKREGYYVDADQTHLVLRIADPYSRQEGKLLDFTSFGSLGLQVGDNIYLQNQTGSSTRYTEVVGIARPDGTNEGDVPCRKLNHWVAK